MIEINICRRRIILIYPFSIGKLEVDGLDVTLTRPPADGVSTYDFGFRLTAARRPPSDLKAHRGVANLQVHHSASRPSGPAGEPVRDQNLRVPLQ